MMAVLSLSGISISTSIKTAGDLFDDCIIKYIRRKYNLIIGKRMAEEAKIAIGLCVSAPGAADLPCQRPQCRDRLAAMGRYYKR